MPTYEYACNACGQHLEVVQSFSDDPLTACPHCGGDLRKVFGAIGIVLKGSGFYKTDSRPSGKSRSGNGVKGDGASTSSDAKSGESSPSDSDTKGSAATKESKESKATPKEGSTSKAATSP